MDDKRWSSVVIRRDRARKGERQMPVEESEGEREELKREGDTNMGKN